MFKIIDVSNLPFAMHLKSLLLFILIGLITGLNSLYAQDASPGPVKPLFLREDLLELSLEADFTTVFSNMDDTTLFPAKITFTDNSGFPRTIDIQIRTRGKTRREKDVCSFKPLRLEFPKKGTENSPFDGQKAIKLVTHCNKQEFYEQNTILEYLIYKSYNVLTDSSFRVRAAKITYIYTDGKNDTISRFAFFLEREKHLAERLNGVENEIRKTNPTLLSPHQTCLMDVFQYMIGNTDYSTYDLHNIVLIADSAGRLPPFPVPYDFDWSGLVSANYAVPNPVVGTAHVKDRVYRGFKKDAFIVNNAIRKFIEKKEAIYAIFTEYELLDPDEEKQVIKYLDDFYEVITNKKKVKSVFIDNARVVEK